MSNETWKMIPGFAGYEVSDQGEVRSYRKIDRYHEGQCYLTPHLLKPATDARGYRRVNLRRNGQTYSKRVASLVLMAFVGPRPNRMEVCHNNSKPGDDCLKNLRYDTSLGNKRDRLNLSNSQVIKMRKRCAQGESISAIARSVDINYSRVHDICQGRTYRIIGGPFTTSGRGGRLTINDVIAMRTERANNDVTLKNLGKKYGISESFVSLICRGKRYQNDGGPITAGKSVRNRSAQNDLD